MIPDFTIPLSVRVPSHSLEGWPFERPGKCWECGAPLPAGQTGAYEYCGPCNASIRQQLRQDAARDREDRDDDD